MDDAAGAFHVSECHGRVQRWQSAMGREGLDAVLLTTPADVFYITGFLTRFWESPARPWFVVVPVSGQPVAVIPSIGAAVMARTWVSDIRTWDAPDPHDDGVTLLGETLRELSPKNGRIGLPMGLETHLRMPLADFNKLCRDIAPRTICDATQAVQRTREVKSDAEIARIRRTCAIADAAFASVPDIAKPGRPLEQIFRDFQAALLHAGADWVSYLAGAAGPCGYGDVISPADSRPLAHGDVLMLDTGAVKNGYFCDFDRNFFVGPPSLALLQTHTALWDATDDVITQLRPGMTAQDVHKMLWDGLRERGVVPCEGRLGHGLGITLTEWPSFTPKDTTELRAGMVLTIEPSAYVDGQMFLTHEENIVLRDTGAELLSKRAPRDPVVIT